MKKKYIFIEPDGDISRWLFHDLENAEDVDVLLKPVDMSSSCLRFLRKIHFSKKINNIVKIPLKSIWESFYTISNYPFEAEYEYYIIIGNFAITYFHLEFLEKLRRRGNIKIVLYFTDPVCSEHATVAYETTKKFNYDYVYTFDSSDAIRYNFYYTGLMYSYKHVAKKRIESDIYFVGVNKNRLATLRKIYKKLTDNGVNCDFYVAGVNEQDVVADGIIYNKRCSYNEVVEKLQSYRAILEVLQNGQSGVTLRYYEAICYNKKLITNNPEVKKLPFYSSDNIFVFNDICEIDPCWVLEGTPDYGYKGEFSPLNWIRRIGNEEFEENRKIFY
ncbi:hypothetical protein [Macellibacteroides fermentans]|uniref:hypothetical protein n=1 Tax=Macellibacteroides fermentans TaxID=879969 RepID=UPI00406BFFD9